MNPQQSSSEQVKGSKTIAVEGEKSVRRKAIFLFGLLFFCYSFIHQHMGWNQNSRLDLLHALFVHKTFKIDAYHENTGDKSTYQGHFYSDKAPGIVFIAIPAFALAKEILHLANVPLDSEKGWLASSWITTVGSVGLITAFGGVAMFLFLRRFVQTEYAFITTMVTFLGAAPFPYATMLFSHAAVIGFICIALWAIADDYFVRRMTCSLSAFGGEGRGEVPSNSWRRRHTLAGLCCGLAISSEYTAAIAAGGVLALALLTSFKRGRVLSFGAVPPLLLIPIYNWICFGGPVAFGYHNLALPEFQEMSKGLFGITFPPKLSAAYLVLLSPARGLFFWTPFFLIAFAGAVPLFGFSSKLAWASVSALVLHVLCISAYYMPDGGAALGPRHLAPMLPFLCLIAAFGFGRVLYPGIFLGYCSLLLTGTASAIEAMPPAGSLDALLSFYIVRLARAESAYLLSSLLDVPAYHGAFSLIGILVVAYFYCVSSAIWKQPPLRNRS